MTSDLQNLTAGFIAGWSLATIVWFIQGIAKDFHDALKQGPK